MFLSRFRDGWNWSAEKGYLETVKVRSIEEPGIKTSLLHFLAFQENRGKLSPRIASMDLGELCAIDNTSKIPLVTEDVTLKAKRQAVEIRLENLEK